MVTHFSIEKKQYVLGFKDKKVFILLTIIYFETNFSLFLIQFLDNQMRNGFTK